MNLQKNGMNGQERKEWEALCRQYNVDSLYEAIQGCREELEFLIHCAERLEPHTEEEEETPFNTTAFLRTRKRRLTDGGNAVSPRMIQKNDYFLTEYNFINIINIKYGKLEIY